MNVVETLGTYNKLSDSTISTASKLNFLNDYKEYYDWQSVGIFKTDGTKIDASSTNISDREYFKTALSGETAVSDPIYSKDTSQLISTVAAPIWQDGTRDTEVVGVVVVCMDASTLSNIVAAINVSDNGAAFLLNSSGDIIAHTNYDLVVAGENMIEGAETDFSLQKLAALEKKMINGETGFGTYTYDGETKFLAFAPVSEINGWSIAVNAPINDFMSGVYQSIAVTVAVMVIAMIIATIIATKLSDSIGIPLQKCADRLKKLSNGDLQSEVPTINSRDETKELAESTELLVNNLKLVIGDIDYMLGEMASGDMTVCSQTGQDAYVGDLGTIFLSVQRMHTNISNTLTQINTASEQVASGSEQLAAGSTSLSQGATEQAASVEELAATINEISNQTSENAEHAATAEKNMECLGETIKSCDAQMKQLIGAMQDISTSSSEIGKIIKTIEDIAFQTNILALNAAVEAARAGTAGKGFAVVADEVRNLAGKSAEAANNTTALIKRAILSIQDGSRMVDDTGASLNEVVLQTDSVMESMNRILNATEHQAESIHQVTTGIEQISSVIQVNSSSAEESAATSQELSSQAELLKNLVGTFKFND